MILLRIKIRKKIKQINFNYKMRSFYRSLKKRAENEITSVDKIQLLAKDIQKNIFDPVNEISIIGKKHSGNIIEPIDEIQIIGKEIITNIYEPIDEIEIIGKERIDNVYEPIDEIEIIGMELDLEKINKKEENNILTKAFELQISPCQNKKEKKIDKDKKYNALMAFINNDDATIKGEDIDDKENIDNNILLNMNENNNKKLKDINKLKSQLEKEKKKLKKIVTKIIELENEFDGEKI